jgi:CRP-like cAMP-binding protein
VSRFFLGLSDELRSQIAERSEIIDYGSGKFTVRQGDQGDSLYIIRTGLCGVYVRKYGKHEKKELQPLTVVDFLVR